MNLPKHIVIIPDGNRRWAKKRGLPSFFGHREGAKTLEKILKVVLDLKIPYFTFWGCSVNNLTKRSALEVKFLLSLFGRCFKKLNTAKEIHQNQIKVDVLGRWDKYFPRQTQELIKEIIKKTKNYRNYQFTFLMAYSGIDEMTTTIQRIAELRSKNSKLKIDEELIKKNLWTKDLPPVDLVIRTGSNSDPHWSNGLMMWDVANAQLHFSKIFWPDFTPEEFKKIIKHYSQTERRMGA